MSFSPASIHRLRTDIMTGETTLDELQQEALSLLNDLALYANPNIVLSYVEEVFGLEIK